MLARRPELKLVNTQIRQSRGEGLLFYLIKSRIISKHKAEIYRQDQEHRAVNDVVDVEAGMEPASVDKGKCVRYFGS